MGDVVTTVLERGDIQFFFQPLVQPAEADEYVLGVQSFFAILSPARTNVHRRLRVGKKRMPATSRERFWARVERVGTMQRALGSKLESEQYSTKTRGERFQPGARPIAHGAYAFSRSGDHIHLAYDVQPFGFEDAPEEIRIPEAASHRILFKNRGRGRAVWTHDGDLAELDREGTQIVLCGAKPLELVDVGEELLLDDLHTDGAARRNLVA